MIHDVSLWKELNPKIRLLLSEGFKVPKIYWLLNTGSAAQ